MKLEKTLRRRLKSQETLLDAVSAMKSLSAHHFRLSRAALPAAREYRHDIEKIVEDIRELLRNDEAVNQEFILVNWTDFGSSSLDILVYYFSNTTKWLEYMEVRQRINVKIAKVVAKHGSSIAFPTRTLYFEGDIARRMAEKGD